MKNPMKRPSIAAARLATIVLFACGLAIAGVQPRPGVAQWSTENLDSNTNSETKRMAPPLVHRYAEEGLWDWDRLILDLRKNPFYVRGDFDGDGATDVAVYVLVRPNDVQGLVVLHGSVDKLRIFAKHENPDTLFFPGHPRIEVIDIAISAGVGEYVRIEAVGTRIEPWPCEGARYPGCEEGPFTLQHEAFETYYTRRSSELYVWRRDRYVRFVTGD